MVYKLLEKSDLEYMLDFVDDENTKYKINNFAIKYLSVLWSGNHIHG